MNLDEILSLPNLSLSQSRDELEEQLKQWKHRQLEHLHRIYDQSIEQIHLFYQTSWNQFEHSKNKVMDDFIRIVDDCSLFTINELDMYLERIFRNVDKLKAFKPIQLRELGSSSIEVSCETILVSEWMDPMKIHFSQSTIDGNTSMNYRIRMSTGEWMWNRHPDEHQASSALRVALINEQFVSFDNRRLYAAQDLRLKRIPIIQVNLDDRRPTTTMTWRNAFENRLKKSKLPPEGTSTQPELKF